MARISVSFPREFVQSVMGRTGEKCDVEQRKSKADPHSVYLDAHLALSEDKGYLELKHLHKVLPLSSTKH